MSWKLKAIRMKMRKKSTSNAKTNLRDIYWKQSNLHSHCSSQKKTECAYEMWLLYKISWNFHQRVRRETLFESNSGNQLFFFSWNAYAQPLAIDQFNSKYICIWDIFSGELSEKSHTHTKTTYSQTIFFISWDISVLCPCLKRLVHCSMYTFLDH